MTVLLGTPESTLVDDSEVSFADIIPSLLSLPYISWEMNSISVGRNSET
jgi:hypothetical protein